MSTDSELLRHYLAIGDCTSGYLPMDALQPGWVYLIFARNAHVGVWWPEKKGFLIPREKFEHRYLFVEYHADSGVSSNLTVNGNDVQVSHGTVKPFEPLEQAPFELSDELLQGEHPDELAYLESLQASVPHEEAIERFYRRITNG